MDGFFQQCVQLPTIVKLVLIKRIYLSAPVWIIESSDYRSSVLLYMRMKDRCGFLFVRYKRHFCTELISWEHVACPLSGIKGRPLVGG